ncbi:MAG: hypothetical protein KIT62_09810 [Cyclobacteriaceae bacterium]|nr:hypothetical protein [Cyclobacteriaceae bacterium]
MLFGQMKLQTILLLFGLLILGQVNGQLILTEEENLCWIEKLKSEKELEKQLIVLRARILADTNVYVKPIGDRVILKTEENKNIEIGLCRPLLIVEGYYISMTNNTEQITIENLVKELTTDNIKQLEILDGEKAKSLFGQNGWCGVIFLKTTNKKAKKILLRYKV